MSALLEHLRDGHAELRTPFARYSYDDWYENFPENFSWPVIQERLGASPPRTPSGIRHGWLTTDVGYLLFEQFGSPLLTEEFDQVLERFSGARGLVLDVRNNAGGSDLRTEAVAGRFADRVRHYRTFRYRNGPKHNDFTVPELDSIRPAGDRRFTGPVVVLTNRRTFSAAEAFVLAMRVIPGVTIVGDTTGGGAGNPISRELPNGWTYRISRWIVETSEGASYEGIGLGPDVFVEITEQDAAAGVDTILESAIALLAAP